MRSASSRWPRPACARSPTRPAPSSPTTAGRRPGSVVAPTLEGSRPLLVEVQALVSPAGYGNPSRKASGLDPNRLSLLIAVLGRRAGIALGSHDVYANLAGGLTVVEPGLDLPLALALASSSRDRPIAAGHGRHRRGRPARRAARAWPGSSAGCARRPGSASSGPIVPRPAVRRGAAADRRARGRRRRDAPRRHRRRPRRPPRASWRGRARDARLTARPGRSRPGDDAGHRRGRPLIRYIRVLGAALGRAHRPRAGRRPATGCSRTASTRAPCSRRGSSPGSSSASRILPYLTVVPAAWLIRRVEALSTAEFVTAVIGLLLGLLMGLLLGLPLSAACRRRGARGCRSACRSSSASGCSG